MKTSAIISGICMLAAIVVIGCNKESEDLISTPMAIENKKLVAGHDCDKVDICKSDGLMISVSINAAYNQLSKGGMLFSCNPTTGVHLSQIQSQLNNRVIAAGGSITSKTAQSAAFEAWYYDMYCAPDTDSEGGGVFEDDAGSDL